MGFDQRTAEAKVAPRFSNPSKARRFELRKNAGDGDQWAAVLSPVLQLGRNASNKFPLRLKGKSNLRS